MDQHQPGPNNTTAVKMVTRCPQCGTSFRITAAQLQSARGAVRCGACLCVFKAREHLIGNEPTTPASPSETSQSSPTESSPQPEENSRFLFDQSQIDAELGDDDDFLISDDMDQKDDPEVRDPYGVGDSLHTHSTRSLFERAPQEEDSGEKENADESWAMSLLEEESDEAPAPPESQAAPQTEPQVDSPAHDPSLPFQLTDSDKGSDNESQEETALPEEEVDTPFLAHFDPGPVEMQGHRKPRRKRRWLWPTLVVLALSLTVAQVAWLQFDRLSRQEPYRSLYVSVCSVLGCTVPDLTDPSRIRAYNLVVRDHPERVGALMVDAILLNTAPFSQPFPDLVLEFSGLDGETLAVRQFKPSEYLSGELSGRRIMPANQPIHLTLELIDPGPDAVNYRAYIPGA